MGLLRPSAAFDLGFNDKFALDHAPIQLRDNAAASNVRGAMMDDIWLPTLQTDSPQEGIELAVKLSRLGMMLSQSSNDIDKESRGSKTLSSAQLIAAAHVIALNFQTIAAANDGWRHESARRNS
jgi:hypothetical protein